MPLSLAIFIHLFLVYRFQTGKCYNYIISMNLLVVGKSNERVCTNKDIQFQTLREELSRNFVVRNDREPATFVRKNMNELRDYSIAEWSHFSGCEIWHNKEHI